MTEVDPGSPINKILAPTSQQDRIHSLDLLRGCALLGILVVNIQGVAMISAAYQNPTAYGSLEGGNYWVWWIMHMFFEMKMMSIFSMLFGAGIALVAESAERRQKSGTGLHYRRMVWLFAIGMAHAYLIWYGDILVCYAICGMVLYWMRNRKPLTLAIVGLCLFAIPSALNASFAVGFQYMSTEEIATLNADWQPTATLIQEELNAYRGSWLQQMPHRAETAFMVQTFVNLILFFWRAGGLMLFGMALYKTGFLQARKSIVFYLSTAVVGGIVGWYLVLLSVARNEAANWEVTYGLSTGSQFNYWGSLCVAMAYLSIIVLWFRSGIASWLQRSIQAVGQMALTNYLMQSVLMTLIFWGHGLGLAGKLERVEQLMIVIAIWIFQLVLSPIWLRYFRFGPCEWMWRNLSYWRIQPLWRSTRV